jgi:hypothetical protein
MSKLWYRVWTEGMVAGIVGYAVVDLSFAIVNVLLGRSPFFSAALLGSRLFFGLDDPSELVIQVGPVLAYNGAHLVVFLGLGFVTAWLANFAERGPSFWYIGLVMFLVIVAHVVAAFLVLTEPLRAVLSAWHVLATTFLATLAMTGYIWWIHPRLHEEHVGDSGRAAPGGTHSRER